MIEKYAVERDNYDMIDDDLVKLSEKSSVNKKYLKNSPDFLKNKKEVKNAKKS